VKTPSTITVPANATSASFTAPVSAVTFAQVAQLTAIAGSVSTGFVLQLNPAAAAALTVNANSVSFGCVMVNTPATQPVTLTSTGTSPVTVSAASVTGTGFTLSGSTFPTILNPGQTMTLNVQFDPTTPGTETGQLTITSNSVTNGTAQVSLSGTGMPHDVALSWNAPTGTSGQIAGYNVYRSPSGRSSYQRLNASTNTQYTDNTVQSGTAYDYIVKSVDASGMESAPSNMTTVTIPEKLTAFDRYNREESIALSFGYRVASLG
jgi:Abnormal spindle-like microcephaly-assoc'd, ASPM-SPD-2-Hydin/Fibronectin type III domain